MDSLRNDKIEEDKDDWKLETNKAEESSDDIPKQIRILASDACADSLPKRSKELYETAYKDFLIWKKKEGTKSNDEVVLLAYLKELSEKYKPSSLWAKFSMIGSMLQFKENVNTKNYHNCIAFLKQKKRGFRSVKAKVLSREDISKFLSIAPDTDYLGMKVSN